MKPTSNIELGLCTLVLNPWKRKISKYVFVVKLNLPIDNQVKSMIEKLRKEGKNKRRTVIGYEISINEKL